MNDALHPDDLHHATVLEIVADAIPEAPALIQGDRVVTYADLDSRAARLAAALTGAGLDVQARVAIDLYNSNEWLESYYGVLKDRFVPVSINYRYLDDELRHLLYNSESEALIYHASMADRVVPVAKAKGMKIIVQVDDVGGADVPDGVVSYDELIGSSEEAPRTRRRADDFVMWYTGGTTGIPKGIVIPQGRSAAMSVSPEGRLRTLGRFSDPPESIDADLGVSARKLWSDGSRPIAIPAAPLMHSTAAAYAGPAIIACGGAVVTLERRTFDADELFAAVDVNRVSTIAIVGDAFAVPMAKALEARAAAGQPYDGSSIKTIYSAGVVWSADVKQRLLDHLPGAMLVDNCGSSEGAWYGSSIVRKGEPATSSSFVPAPGVMVLDDDGAPMAPGTGRPGILASPTATKGYHNDAAKTAANFRMIDGEWYTTPGDLGVLNADGTLTLVGRGTNVINTGGEKVFPEEVDDAVKALPEVDDCLVIGTPDAQYGQIVTAVVQRVPGSSLSEIEVTEWVRGRLARYKAPRRVIFVDKVPRLPNGKADYPRARELAGALEAGAT
jgi:fatty-acyl-CoA synthase